MSVGERTRSVETWDLIDSLAPHRWMKLPYHAMRDCGPASQTLAGLLRLNQREVFRAVPEIANKAHMPTATCRKHIKTLAAAGYLRDEGRQRTRAGRPRRTCTLRLTSRAFTGEWGMLPYWSCASTPKGMILPWCARAVLAVVMRRIAGKTKTIEEQDGQADLDATEMWDSLGCLGGDEMWRFSLSQLCGSTGLSRKSVSRAKYVLSRRHIVAWLPTTTDQDGHDADLLIPNDEFVVEVRPAGPGYVTYHF